MHCFSQASVRALAGGAFLALGLLQLPAAAQTPAEKPQNPLEIRAPGKGEEKAYKAFQHFQSVPESDAARKVAEGEGFADKFPTSTYAGYVYSYLAVAYIQAGQVEKGVATGEKALQINPSDFRTMAVLSQTLARTAAGTTSDSAAKLAKAETDANNAIAGVATWVKPDAMPEANFTALKNGTLTMAHASLGLIALHKNNFAAAVPELEQAVQLAASDSANTDPTNYYLLGVAQQNSGHPDKAVPNFEKCAAVKGTSLTATCVVLLDQSKKEAESKAK